MIKKIYCLSTCSTCKAILKDIGAKQKGFHLQDIASEPVTATQLDQMKELSGSYESLFSRRARKYKEMGLQDKNLTETDYKDLILGEYTFLKRPVVILGKKLFAGSEKKTVEDLKRLTG